MRCFPSLRVCSLITCLVGAACGEDDGSKPVVTYHRDVRPLIDAYCIRCHMTGGFGSFSLETENDLLTFNQQVVEAVVSESMPLDADCPDFPGTFTLSQEQRAVFSAWQQGGFELGVASEFKPLAKRCLTPPPE